MGPKAQPRWDRAGRFWYCNLSGHKHYLSRDYAAAWRKFRELTGDDDEPTMRAETVAEARTEWILRYASDWQRDMLEPWYAYAGIEPLAGLPRDHLAGYARHLADRGDSPQTVIHRVRLAARVLRWCAERGWLPIALPTPRLPRPVRRPRDVAPAELSRVFEALPQRARNVLGFILATGCRPSEALRLQWAEVDPPNRRCVLTGHKRAAGGKPRIIHLTDAALAILNSLPPGDGYVFLSRLGRPYTRTGLRAILRRRGLGSMYRLRHTFAQMALGQIPMEDVAKLLGHADLRTVQVYAQVRDERAAAAASRLDVPVPPLPGPHSRPAYGPAPSARPSRRSTSPRTPATARRRRPAG